MKKLLSALIFLIGCSESQRTQFQTIDPEASQILFVNTIDNKDSMNILNYIYYYNGGGVGAGDVNNDGLIDLFLAGNRSADALYLNRGNWKFEDVTQSSGVTRNGWSTGVSMIDINGDGWLDIYVSRAGGFKDSVLRKNILYVNQGDGSFLEQAEQYGIADCANSTHAAFFDFDRDGDLDLYVMNHGNQRDRVNTPITLKNTGLEESNDHLYENMGTGFMDITIQAGLLTEGYGLGLAIADFNQDSWPDIYVANDFVFSDLLYLNNHDGTFNESAQSMLAHQSYNSMGCDVGDMNNDGLPDLITLDMLPKDNQRQKTMTGAMNHNKFQQIVSRGYAHQYMRNMLHQNDGNVFNEVGQLAQVNATDWSWAPLFADFDQDGYQDLFISNGYYKDITDKDFIKYSQDITMFTSSQAADSILLSGLDQLKEVKLHNHAFRNIGNGTFEDASEDWLGIRKTLSNGAIYADLDNDGDLDIVTNNLNAPPGLYRNDIEAKGHYFNLKLEAKFLGSEVTLYSGADIFRKYFNPYRGFMSSMITPIHFGLGEINQIDSAIIIWPDGQYSKYFNLPVDTALLLTGQIATNSPTSKATENASFTIKGLDFLHQEDPFVDFHTQPLLPSMLSREGPALAVGDLNNDGIQDVFLGGAKDQTSVIYYQKEGGFEPLSLTREATYEDVEAKICDLNQDGFNDLIVCSGGYQDLNDRIYFGQRDGNLSVPIWLPNQEISVGALAVADADGDNDLDIFIGGRFVPGQFPTSPLSTLLINEKGKFVTADGWPQKLGLVTGAVWGDLNADVYPDLIVSREWEPIIVFYGSATGISKFEKIGPSGLWRSITVGDLNGDGLPDILAGNFGLNNDFDVDAQKPMELYYADFDHNGAIDPIITHFYPDGSFPMAPRDALLKQIPFMQSRVYKYSSYAGATIDQLLKEEELAQATRLAVTELRSGVFYQQQSGFDFQPFPQRAQFGPIQDMRFELTQDGSPQVLIVGNDFDIEVLGGRQDALDGLVLKRQENGDLIVTQRFELGNARRVEALSFQGKEYWIVAQNDDSIKIMSKPVNP